MRLRQFGRTGVRVSELTLGTMMFGSWGNEDHDECLEIFRAALDAGINVIDTADRYGDGESEEIVAKGLARVRRDDVFLATKVHNPMGDGPNDRGSSRRWILKACEDSLRRLGTDYIDLYQLHRPDPSCNIEESLGALTDLVRAGKVRYVGTSKFSPAQLVEAQWASDRRLLERFVSEQPPYSMLVRGVEAEVLPTCQDHDLAVLTWGPLAGGWLTGRWRQDSVPSTEGNRRVDRQPARFDLGREENRRKLAATEELAQLAEEAGVPLVHLALAWVLNHPAVTSVILGPRTLEQLRGQLDAVNLQLGDDVLDRVDEIVPPGTNFSFADSGLVPPSVGEPALRRRTDRRPMSARRGSPLVASGSSGGGDTSN